MSRSRLLAKNSMVIGLGKLTTSFASFVALPFYVGALSATGYGLVDIITVYLTIAYSVVGFRIDLSLFRWLIDARENDSRISEIITTVSILFLGIIGLVLLIYCIIISAVNVPYSIYILGYFVSMICFNIYVQVPRGLGDNKGYVVANIISGVLSVVVSLIMLYVLHLGPEGVMLGYILGNITSVLFVFSRNRVHRYISSTCNKTLLVDMLKYSTPMIPDQLSTLSIFTGTKLIVTALLGLAANGLYAVAGRFASILLSFTEVLETAWAEHSVLYIKSKDSDQYFSKTINTSLALFFVVGGFLIIFTSIVYPSMISTELSEAYYIIPVLVGGYIFNGGAKMVGTLFLALKKTNMLMTTTVVAGMISIIGTIAFIRILGLWAPVLSVTLAYLYLLMSRYYKIRSLGITVVFGSRLLVGSLMFYLFSCVTYYLGGSILSRALALIVTVLLIIWMKDDVIDFFNKLVKRS